MNCWILIFAALAALASANSGKKIVCYFGSWAGYRSGNGKFDVSSIQPNLCTHLIYSFVGINPDGSIRVMDPWNDLPDNSGLNGFGKFVALRKKSPNTKMIVAIGGWSEGSVTFSKVVNDGGLRKKFVQNVVKFLQKYKFDGFDVDWEYPSQRGGQPQDKQNFVHLLKELRTEFNKHGFILSIAVGATEGLASQSYNIGEISKHVHFVNLMTYDMHGTWETVIGHHAALHPRQGESGESRKLNVDACVHHWLSKGCPPEKLIVGVPFYGRAFALANKNQHNPGAPSNGAAKAGPYTSEGGYLGYNEICELIKKGDWIVVHDKEHRTPYAYKDNQWIGYDDATSLKEKTAYIKSKHLGGAMVWSIDTDDFSGKCGEKYPLLKALNAGLK